MASASGKCRMIRHIVWLRHTLRRWRARACGGSSRAPADVPAGCVAVCVGPRSRRFVVRAAHLNHPAFRELLAEAEEEFGFDHAGPLAVPCDESLFEDVLRQIAAAHCCSAGAREAWLRDTFPLLRGFERKSPVW